MDQAQEQSQPSIKDRIGALLTSHEQPAAPEPQEPAPEQEAAAEQPTEAEAQPETETPQEVPETDPTADWTTVEIDGEAIQVPPKFAKAFMQERDYTQKRQAEAEFRRVLEAREQGMQVREQALQQLQPLYAQATYLQNTIQQYEKLDWQSLHVNDPVEYASKRADYAALLQQRNDLTRHIEQGHQYVQQQTQAAMAQAVKAAEPLIRKAVPDWGPEKDAQLTKYALEAGASPMELSGLASRPWAIGLLEKARKYDELQASKAQLPRKAQALSPVAKPGAKPTVQSSEHALYRKNLEQFRKGGGKDKGALRALIKAKLGT